MVGHWKVKDSFHDFSGGEPLVTDNTDFTFLNPTDLTLVFEYAFFAAPDGKFCGCDRDTLLPNGRTRYTILAEQQGGQFSTTLCPTRTEGEWEPSGGAKRYLHRAQRKSDFQVSTTRHQKLDTSLVGRIRSAGGESFDCSRSGGGAVGRATQSTIVAQVRQQGSGCRRLR